MYYLHCPAHSRHCAYVLHFRSRGATALLAAGYDIAYIKMMGRWSSSCFERYLRLDISAVQDMARAMQTGHRERAPFFFDSLVTDGAETLLRQC